MVGMVGGPLAVLLTVMLPVELGARSGFFSRGLGEEKREAENANCQTADWYHRTLA